MSMPPIEAMMQSCPRNYILLQRQDDMPLSLEALIMRYKLCTNGVCRGRTSRIDHLHKMQDEHRGLTLWCQYGHSRRGLEKFTSRQYCDTRRKQMRQLSQRVVALSKRGADPTELRQASEEASRISITFARILAIAQYKAATSSFPGEDERVKTLEKTTLHPSTVWQRKRAEKRDQVCV